MMFSGASPIYEQLATYYKRLIYSGVFAPGDSLPSVREVALAERVNPNTVVRAYGILMEEGLIVSLPKKGYFVSEEIKPEGEDKLASVLSSLLKEGYKEEDIIATLKRIKEGEND